MCGAQHGTMSQDIDVSDEAVTGYKTKTVDSFGRVVVGRAHEDQEAEIYKLDDGRVIVEIGNE